MTAPTNTRQASGTGESALRFSLITATKPRQITKRFGLKDGKLEKSAACQVTAGRVERVEVDGLATFAALADSLRSSQALTYGTVPGMETAALVRKEDWREDCGAITRTREYFQFAPAAGLLMLDYDPRPGCEVLQPDELIARLTAAAPCLADAPMLWRPSASSGVRAADGSELTGLRGQRLYVPVRDASLIPHVEKALSALLWASGDGYIQIGGAGQMLARALVDLSVFQPERLDFAGPPVLTDGLTRSPPPHRIIGDPMGRFDLRRLIDAADGDVQRRAAVAMATAKAEAKPAAAVACDAWVEAQAPKLAASRKIDVATAADVLRRAATCQELTGDFELIAADGKRVTVGELLDHPARWHGKRFADPLEPDYAKDGRIAWANLRGGGRPYLYSHAHGGRRFNLIRPSRRIQLSAGERARVTDSALDLLRERGELYDLGEGAALARISDEGTAKPVVRDWLVDHLDRNAEFFSLKTDKNGDLVTDKNGLPVEFPRDAPTWLAAAILAKDGERGLPRLDAVITAPTLRRDGSILAEPGYDAASRLLLRLLTPDWPAIPAHPSLDESRAALREFWRPVELFPLVGAVDRGVTLSAMLTALVRASLPTSPGFADDAPTAGSGKTLLAQTIGALATGAAPSVLPPAGDEDEARKRLFAALRDGASVLLWDNVREPLGNAALDAFLTAPVFKDRILGVSEMVALPNRALFLATGNNMRLLGDTCRRILIARMDPQMERPDGRVFDFCPLQTVITNRPRLVTAGLALLRGYIAAGRPRHGQGRTASFEDWDDLVRQTVCWVAAWDDRFADPTLATVHAFESDPETNKLRNLLHAWHAAMGDKGATVAEILGKANEVEAMGLGYANPELMDAIQEIAGDPRGNINRRILGRWIERNAERRLDGLRFVKGEDRHAKVLRWWIAEEDCGFRGVKRGIVDSIAEPKFQGGVKNTSGTESKSPRKNPRPPQNTPLEVSQLGPDQEVF